MNTKSWDEATPNSDTGGSPKGQQTEAPSIASGRGTAPPNGGAVECVARLWLLQKSGRTSMTSTAAPVAPPLSPLLELRRMQHLQSITVPLHQAKLQPNLSHLRCRRTGKPTLPAEPDSLPGSPPTTPPLRITAAPRPLRVHWPGHIYAVAKGHDQSLPFPKPSLTQRKPYFQAHGPKIPGWRVDAYHFVCVVTGACVARLDPNALPYIIRNPQVEATIPHRPPRAAEDRTGPRIARGCPPACLMRPGAASLFGIALLCMNP
jgi:hypothetical protein